MAPAPQLMSVDEYFKTPETVKPMELAFGLLRVAESPSPQHQSAVAGLFRALDIHVRERELGRMWLAPLDVVLNEKRALVVQPDLFFIASNQDAIVTDRVRGAPDLVIEVLSPRPRIGEVDERVGWFAEFGVRECWLVHQIDLTVTLITFDRGAVNGRAQFAKEDPIISRTFPDFHLTLEEILFNDGAPLRFKSVRP
jgi:Uma2 family endonuclease